MNAWTVWGRDISTRSLTSSPDGVGGQRHASAPGKTRYVLNKKLGRLQDRSGRVRKISPPTGIQFRDRSAGREWLHRLSYLGPPMWQLSKGP